MKALLMILACSTCRTQNTLCSRVSQNKGRNRNKAENPAKHVLENYPAGLACDYKLMFCVRRHTDGVGTVPTTALCTEADHQMYY